MIAGWLAPSLRSLKENQAKMLFLLLQVGAFTSCAATDFYPY